MPNDYPNVVAPPGYGWRGEDGSLCLIRCPSCGRENWAPAISSGRCAWCGWTETKETELEALRAALAKLEGR